MWVKRNEKDYVHYNSQQQKKLLGEIRESWIAFDITVFPLTAMDSFQPNSGFPIRASFKFNF